MICGHTVIGDHLENIIFQGGPQILPNTNYQKNEIAQIRPSNTYKGVLK